MVWQVMHASLRKSLTAPQEGHVQGPSICIPSALGSVAVFGRTRASIESYYHYPFFSYKEGRLEVWLDPDSGRDSIGWIEVNRWEGPAT